MEKNKNIKLTGRFKTSKERNRWIYEQVLVINQMDSFGLASKCNFEMYGARITGFSEIYYKEDLGIAKSRIRDIFWQEAFKVFKEIRSKHKDKLTLRRDTVKIPLTIAEMARQRLTELDPSKKFEMKLYELNKKILDSFDSQEVEDMQFKRLSYNIPSFHESAKEISNITQKNIGEYRTYA